MISSTFFLNSSFLSLYSLRGQSLTLCVVLGEEIGKEDGKELWSGGTIYTNKTGHKRVRVTTVYERYCRD